MTCDVVKAGLEISGKVLLGERRCGSWPPLRGVVLLVGAGDCPVSSPPAVVSGTASRCDFASDAGGGRGTLSVLLLLLLRVIIRVLVAGKGGVRNSGFASAGGCVSRVPAVELSSARVSVTCGAVAGSSDVAAAAVLGAREGAGVLSSRCNTTVRWELGSACCMSQSPCLITGDAAKAGLDISGRLLSGVSHCGSWPVLRGGVALVASSGMTGGSAVPGLGRSIAGYRPVTRGKGVGHIASITAHTGALTLDRLGFVSQYVVTGRLLRDCRLPFFIPKQ